MTLAKRVTKRESRRTSHRLRGRRRGPTTGARKVHAAPKAAPKAGPPTVLYRVCKPGWAVLSEKVPSAPHTRFVCPFCPRSHRVPGPVRGFRRVRRPQWLKLHRVFE